MVPATGHTEIVDEAVAATCTKTGLTEGKHCSVCNTVLKAQETVPAKGHTEVMIPGKAATCTETGLTDGKKCSVCGYVIEAQTEIAALGHTEVVDAAVPATCTEKGKTEGKKIFFPMEIAADESGKTEEDSENAFSEIPASRITAEQFNGRAGLAVFIAVDTGLCGADGLGHFHL